MPSYWATLFDSHARQPTSSPVLGKRKAPDDTSRQRSSSRKDISWNGFHAFSPRDISSDEDDGHPLKRPFAGGVVGSNQKSELATAELKPGSHHLDHCLPRSNHVSVSQRSHEASNTAAKDKANNIGRPQPNQEQQSRLQQYLDRVAPRRHDSASKDLNYDREQSDGQHSQIRPLGASKRSHDPNTATAPDASMSRSRLATAERVGAIRTELHDDAPGIFGDINPRRDKPTSSIHPAPTPHRKVPAATHATPNAARTDPTLGINRNQSVTVISDSEDDENGKLHTATRRKSGLDWRASAKSETHPSSGTPATSKCGPKSFYPDRKTKQSGPQLQYASTKESAPDGSSSAFEKEMEGLTRIKDKLAALKKQREGRAKAAEEEARGQEARKQELQRQETQRKEAERLREARQQEARRREAERSRKAEEEASASRKAAEPQSSAQMNTNRATGHENQLTMSDAKAGKPPATADAGLSQAEERPRAYNEQRSRVSKFGTMKSSEAAALIQVSTSTKPRNLRDQEALDQLRRLGRPEDAALTGVEHKPASQPIRLDQKLRPERVTDEHWLIFNLRNSGWSYPDIVSHWPQLSAGKLNSADLARKKYVRMRATYPDLVPPTAPAEQIDQVSDLSKRQRNAAIAERLRNKEAIDDLLAAEGTDDERAKNRREALAGARPKENSTKAENGNKSNRSDGRRTTGGKQISDDLARHIMDTLVKKEEDEDDLDYKPARAASPPRQDDKIHFAYRVHRRTVWPNQDPEATSWIQCGEEYDKILEANQAAITELHIERANLGLSNMSRYLIEFSDKTGLTTCHASGDRGMIDVGVERFERTLEDGREPSTKDGWVSREIYDILEKRTMFYLKEEEWTEKQSPISTGADSSEDGAQASAQQVDAGEANESAVPAETEIANVETSTDGAADTTDGSRDNARMAEDNQADPHNASKPRSSDIDGRGAFEDRDAGNNITTAVKEAAKTASAESDQHPNPRSRTSSPEASSIFDGREGDTGTAATSFIDTSNASEQDPKAETMASEEEIVPEDDWTKQLFDDSCSGTASKDDPSKTTSRCDSPAPTTLAPQSQLLTRTKEVIRHHEKTVRAISSVFGSKSRANAEAAKHFLELQRNLELIPEDQKSRIWFVQKVQEARLKMDERLEELEDEKPGFFNDTILLDLTEQDVELEMEGVDDEDEDEDVGDKGKLMKVIIEVKTIPRRLQNPRNII